MGSQLCRSVCVHNKEQCVSQQLRQSQTLNMIPCLSAFPPHRAHFDRISQQEKSQLGKFCCSAIVTLGSEKVHFKISRLTSYSFFKLFSKFFYIEYSKVHSKILLVF